MARVETFHEIERAGWSAKAEGYRSVFSDLTAQVHPTVLTLFGDLAGAELLDVACGPGVFLREAAAAGAAVTGVDFAPAMVDIARKTAPGAPVEIADAAALPFPDETYDAVTCLFGLWHMTDPDAALKEMCRVLRPGGRIVTATFAPPQKGFDLFGIVVGAIKAEGTMDIDLPPAPPPFRFADSDQAADAMAAAGFADVGFVEATINSTHEDADAVLRFLDAALVRAPLLIARQPDALRDKVIAHIHTALQARQNDGGITLRWPVVICRAVASSPA